jgi:hypothetical protein
VKKPTMITAETIRSIVPLSGKRLARNCGMVSALPSRSVCSRSRGATMIQLRPAPTVSPIAIHASTSPLANSAPGSPSSSQPDMSDAPALSAVTAGPSPRPASR